MRSIPTKLSLEKLAQEINQFSDEFWTDGSGAKMAIRPCHGIPEWLKKCPEIMAALQEISLLRSQEVLHVMINKLPAGVIVPNHTDTLAPTEKQGEKPQLERWHLPVTTNGSCYYWSRSQGFLHMFSGSWWGCVRYWEEHAVENTGTTERIHIVVDLDTPERIV